MTSTLSTVRTDSHNHDVAFVERARRLRPLIEAQAEATEANRMVSAEIVQALRDNGLFWVGTPRDVGGSGGSIVDFIEVTEELARSDASVGWIEMVSGISSVIINGFMADEGSTEIYRGASHDIVAGFAAPIGKAVQVPGGYRVTGQWPFASGCDNADWLSVGFTAVDQAGAPLVDATGKALSLFGALRASSVEIIRTWDVTGMRGTGSHDFRAEDVFVPEYRVMDAYSLTPIRSDGIYFLGKDAVGVAGHTGVALGIMKRALQEVVAITDGKVRRGYPTAVGDYPVFLYEFAKADAKYQSARSYLLEAYAQAQEQATREHTVSPALRARMRQAATWAHHTVDEVVSFARVWGASQAFRNPSVLGRIVRDANVITQHLLIDNITLVDAGRVVLDDYKTLMS